jgi:hypothetical protein
MCGMGRREFVALLGGASAAVVTMPLVAAAQDYPNRPVTLIVNFPPGGSTDAMARIIREPLSHWAKVIPSIGIQPEQPRTDRAVAVIRKAEGLVWRFRSPHHSRGKSEMRTSEPKPH